MDWGGVGRIPLMPLQFGVQSASRPVYAFSGRTEMFSQTRMLADLTLVNCYDASTMESESREGVMLESAKSNLKAMAFFGVKERMNESQYLFERLFALR